MVWYNPTTWFSSAPAAPVMNAPVMGTGPVGPMDTTAAPPTPGVMGGRHRRTHRGGRRRRGSKRGRTGRKSNRS